MKKKFPYTRPLIALVVIIGAYHVFLFGMNPKLPAVARTEVLWGGLSAGRGAPLQTPLLNTAYCSDTMRPTTGDAGATDNSGTADHRIRFEYRPVADEIINTGPTLQVLMDRGSSITVDGATYHLKQFMFQKANTQGGKGQMAFYLIHRAADGKVAVIAIPLQIGKEANPVITALWRYLPPHAGEHNSLNDIHVDINNLVPHDRTYYRYASSGKCDRNIDWFGLQSPVTITAAQMAKLDKALAQSGTSESF